MQRTSVPKDSRHFQRNPDKYAAAKKAENLDDAETVARAFNKVIADPKRNSRQIYLKRSGALPGVRYLSTENFSRNERPIDWLIDCPQSQSGEAKKIVKAFATQLKKCKDEHVKQAAEAVLYEVTKGRATAYGGISSSRDLRACMNRLVEALDVAKKSQPPQAEPPQAVEPERQPLKSVAHPHSYRSRRQGAQQGAMPQPVRKAVPAQLDTPPVVQAKLPALCSAPYRGQRFGAYSTSPKTAALAVHRYLSEGQQAPDGFLSLSFDNKGAAYVEVRTADAKTAPEAAQGRSYFAVFLKDLCVAFAEHPDPKVRDAATKGIKLAEFGIHQALPNGAGMRQLFSVLAHASPDTGRKHARRRTVTTHMRLDDPNRFNTAGHRTASELLHALRAAPDSDVLYTVVKRGTATTGTRAPAARASTTGGGAAPGSRGPADSATCQLLNQLAQDFRHHKDADVRAMAQKLQDVASASAQNNRAIPNHKGLHQILATLAQAS